MALDQVRSIRLEREEERGECDRQMRKEDGVEVEEGRWRWFGGWNGWRGRCSGWRGRIVEGGESCGGGGEEVMLLLAMNLGWKRLRWEGWYMFLIRYRRRLVRYRRQLIRCCSRLIWRLLLFGVRSGRSLS